MVALRVAARGSSTDSAQWELQTARSVLQLDRSAPWELQLLRTRNDRFAQWELQLLHTHAQDTAGSPSGSSTWDASPPAQSPSGMPDGSWWAGDGPLPYAACYCEENAWQLCARARRLGRDLPGFFVVFISNPARTVRLFKQRAGRDHMGHVIWDYHVVVIVQSADRSIVYDQDTTMTPFPIDFETYMTGTFPLGESEHPRFRSMFRVVPAERYPHGNLSGTG